MILVPLEILKRHIQFSSNVLGNLIKDVQQIEEDVAAADFEKIDFNDIIRRLHSCNTALINLEKRWRLENQLSTTIREFIATYKQPLTRSQDVKFFNCEFARGGTNTTTNIKLSLTKTRKRSAQMASRTANTSKN
jgi:hypothetical protein